MSKKRKDDDVGNFADKNEMMKLTKVVKSWEYTCSFCFKMFPSAQAMGGHQNAHRSERLEERRKFVRDPIGYRKRAYLKAMKNASSSSGSGSDASNPTPTPRAPSPPNNRLNNLITNDSDGINVENNNESAVRLMNLFPPKELNPAESVGVVPADANAADHGKGDELDVGGHGINLEKLDLTLKL